MTTGEVFPGFVFRHEDDEVQGAWDPVNGIHSVRGGRQLLIKQDGIKQDGPGVGSRGWKGGRGSPALPVERRSVNGFGSTGTFSSVAPGSQGQLVPRSVRAFGPH